jgi:CPA1 family monovalent cation:H+ antiporter
MSAASCVHQQDLKAEDFPPPRTPDGCEECLQAGTFWVALRLCKECGHVGCCDSSVGKHATRHFEETGHPVMRSVTPPTAVWTWCYVHGVAGTLAPFHRNTEI